MIRKFLAIATLSVLVACGQSENAHSDANHGENTEHAEEHGEDNHEEGNGAEIIAEVGDYAVYGHNAEVTPDSALTTEEFVAMLPEAKLDQDYKVQIILNEVCQKMGCWSNFKINEDETMMVFFKDHYTIPIESNEKEAIIYGRITLDTLSVDFQKHLLEDKKEAGEEVPQAEFDAISKDKIQKNFQAESILLKK